MSTTLVAFSNAVSRRVLLQRGSRRSCAMSSSMTTRQQQLQLPKTTTLQQQQQRTFVSRTLPLYAEDELPYHVVMGMPALSPTMESGGLAEWYVKEGDSFIAGDSLAKIETDKASMEFEAQDDGYCAKILVEAGGPDEIPVGKPIMVTVEEEEDVAAFANYTPPEDDTPAAASAPPKEEKKEAAAAPPPPPKEEAAAPPPPPPSPPKEEAAAAAPPPPPAPAAPAQSSPPPTSGWGSLAFQNSPIAKSLSKKQKKYVEMYGTTGQAPL